jgi:hypothetical protein
MATIELTLRRWEGHAAMSARVTLLRIDRDAAVAITYRDGTGCGTIAAEDLDGKRHFFCQDGERFVIEKIREIA